MSCRIRIGLTGGIGSGKSTVAEILAGLGVPVIDTDQIARELAEPGQTALDEIVTAFGDSILDANGRLDRRRLRDIVFLDTDRRRQLEKILHPRILERALEQAEQVQAPYCVLVVPLLVETGSAYPVDRILVVDTPVELQIQRVRSRDGLSEAETSIIIDSQASRQQRLAVADDVISNDADFDSLQAQTARLHAFYTQLAGKKNPLPQ